KLDLLHKQSPWALLATAFIPLIYAYLVWNALSHSLLLGWYGIFLVLGVIRYWEGRRWAKTSHDPNISNERIDRAKLYFDLLALASGVTWGLVGLTVTPITPPYHQILTILMLAGIVSGAVITYSSSTRTIVMCIFPMLIPLILRLLTVGNPDYTGMAA